MQRKQQQHRGSTGAPTPEMTAAATAAADAALGRVRCLRVVDERALLSALDCLGQRLLSGAEVRLVD